MIISTALHAVTSDVGAAPTDAAHLTYTHAAMEAARSVITTVPGSGDIRGIAVYDGDVYAVRDNGGGTAGVLWKATTAGWVQQDLGHFVEFATGTSEIVDGDLLIGASSGAMGTVLRIYIASGTWAGGDAEGWIAFDDHSGTFQAGDVLQVDGVVSATTVSASTANALPAGGRYEFVVGNFYGASNYTRLYGVNGVGTAFEWDGTTFVPLNTGMTTDTPAHIAIHKYHLFLTFPGGSVQHSGVGDPYSWSPVVGAGEIAIGQDVTGLVSYLDVLVIFGVSTIKLLYGTGSADWELKTHSQESGAIEWSVQQLVQPLFLDGVGVRDLQGSQRYGDIQLGSLSQAIEPDLKRKAKLGYTVLSSLRAKDKDQYRLYYSDGTGIVLYSAESKPQISFVNYGKEVLCTANGENDAGQEMMFFGSDDGYVYQLDKGGSFDGATLSAYLRTSPFHIKRPQVVKRWHKCTIETDTDSTATIKVRVDFDFGLSDVPSSITTADVNGGVGVFGEGNFSEVFFDSPVETYIDFRIDGHGRTVSFVISTDSLYDEPFTLNGITTAYSLRRQVR